MAEETQSGQPVATPASVPTEPVSVPTAPAVPTPTPPPSGGRSVDELFNEMQELKRTNAELAEKATRAQYEAEYTRNLMDTFRQGGKQQQEQAPVIPEITDDEFLQNPGKTIDKKITALWDRERAEREKEKQAAYVESARNKFETGGKTAMEKLSKLTYGIENEVKQQIRDGIIGGAIDPDAALDPDLWAVTALAYRYKVKGERNFDKYLGETRTGMSPSHTETPTAGQPPQDVVALTDNERAMARFMNVTDEQWLKSKQAGGK